MKNLILLIICICMIGTANAADYYVAQNDLGDGTGSCSTAESVANFNAGNLADNNFDGDTIHFCGTITTPITIPDGGQSSARATYTGDGTAIISPVTSVSSFSVESGNIYKKTGITTEPMFVWIDSDADNIIDSNEYIPRAHWPAAVSNSTPTFAYTSGNGSTTTLIDSDLDGMTESNLVGTKALIYPTSSGYVNCFFETADVTAFNDDTDTLTLDWGSSTALPAGTGNNARYYLIAQAATGATYSNKSWMMHENTWFWDKDNTTLYVWKTGGGDPGTVIISEAQTAVNITDKSNITISDLNIRGVGFIDNQDKPLNGYFGILSAGIYISSSGSDDSNITISGCNFSYPGLHGILSTGTGVSNLAITNCTIDHAIQAITLYGAYNSGSIVSNTITSSGGWYPMLPYWQSGIYIYSNVDLDLDIGDNTIASATYCGISSNGLGVKIYSNTITDTNVLLSDGAGIYVAMGNNSTRSAPQIYYNKITNSSTGIYLDEYSGGVSSISVQENKITSGANSIIGINIHGSMNNVISRNYLIGTFSASYGAIRLDDRSGQLHDNTIMYNIVDGASVGLKVEDTTINSNNIVVNNTIANCAIGLRTTSETSNSAINVFKNNLFYNNTLDMKPYEVADIGGTDRNLYYPGAWQINETVKTWTTWKDLGFDTLGINSNPLLNSDYTLSSSSPAINAGDNSLGDSYKYALIPGSSWPNAVGIGNQDHFGAGWEIGAYLYYGSGGVMIGGGTGTATGGL